MSELNAKIERLRARYFHEPTMPPGDVLDLIEQLRPDGRPHEWDDVDAGGAERPRRSAGEEAARLYRTTRRIMDPTGVGASAAIGTILTIIAGVMAYLRHKRGKREKLAQAEADELKRSMDAAVTGDEPPLKLRVDKDHGV